MRFSAHFSRKIVFEVRGREGRNQVSVSRNLPLVLRVGRQFSRSALRFRLRSGPPSGGAGDLWRRERKADQSFPAARSLRPLRMRSGQSEAPSAWMFDGRRKVLPEIARGSDLKVWVWVAAIPHLKSEMWGTRRHRIQQPVRERRVLRGQHRLRGTHDVGRAGQVGVAYALSQ
jgi:hypothetical protein